MDVTRHLSSALARLTYEADSTRQSPDFPQGETIPGVRDHSPVPDGIVSKLTGIANSLGYRVRWVREIDEDPTLLGRTCNAPWNQEILLRDDMTPAGTVRVLCHELAHAFAWVTGQNFGSFEEEYAAESVAALVTKTLGCTDGVFSRHYLACHGDCLLPALPVAITRNFTLETARTILEKAA